MIRRTAILAVLTLAATVLSNGASAEEREILVTYENSGATATRGVRAPYRARNRYSMSVSARRDAGDIEREFGLTRVDHWPIKSLGIYCFVYRVPESTDVAGLLARLRADARIDSAQPMNEFRSGTTPAHNDTYLSLQHGFATLGIQEVHQVTRGAGIRIAVIDSNVDRRHEDLRGQVRRISDYTSRDNEANLRHGTAVVSVIAANANNSAGIAGVAPEADVDVHVACWAAEDGGAACSSVTLAKAIDALVGDPPDVLNMSLTGPHDPLLARLIGRLAGEGVIVVAAAGGFPANLPDVVAASSLPVSDKDANQEGEAVYAPGNRILVAAPDDEYEFQSGSSLASAHVSGVVALLLSVSPELDAPDVPRLLYTSVRRDRNGVIKSVHACAVLALAHTAMDCSVLRVRLQRSELHPETH
jgi:hypothetical protein